MNNASTLNLPISIIQTNPLKFRFNLKIFWILSFILIIFFSVFYIFQVNNLAKSIYQIKIYQKKLEDISQEKETLEVNIVKEDSLTNLETLIKDLGFEKAEKIRYLEVLETQIATK